ncbi:MAG: serine/threonine-protein phosphatase [Sedimentisphaerales bacterium]|nr:serine/threonine-protein phosphatase [Sedimentisphaerales bacterium]
MTDHSSGGETTVSRFGWGAVTDIGKLRERNEDAFVVEVEAGLFLVVDGMGGHRGGGLAARMVAQDLPPMIENGLDALKSRHPRVVRALLKAAIVEQSGQLLREGDSESGCAGMGATLALLLISDGRAYVANVGDSRVYRLRRGRLARLSVDHSVVSELLEAGQITPEEATGHSSQGIVTQYMGMPEQVEPLVRSTALNPGDRFLLCTDGLTDLASDAAITAVLKAETDPQIACDRLVDAANRAGGADNITAVVVTWPEAS